MQRTFCGHNVPQDQPRHDGDVLVPSQACATCRFEENVLRIEEQRLQPNQRLDGQPSVFLERTLQFQHHGDELCDDCGGPLVLVGGDGPYGEGTEWWMECPIEAGVEGEHEGIQGYTFNDATERWERDPRYPELLLAHLRALHDHLQSELGRAQEESAIMDLAENSCMAA